MPPHWHKERRIGVAVVFAAAFFVGGAARYRAFHNETFDLALYARMAWGIVHGDAWQPILNAHALGLHVSIVLLPVGLLGLLIGQVNALLVTQAVATAAAGYHLSNIALRRDLSPLGVYLALLALYLHPNTSHVLTYEAHPGTIALWPLAYALDRGTARDFRGFVKGALLTLACREDFALLVALTAIVFRPSLGRRCDWLIAGSLAWIAVFTFVVHPLFAVSGNSFELHFGYLGQSPGNALQNLPEWPSRIAGHLSESKRLLYLPMVLAPLAFLSLGTPKWLLPALPTLAINLLSEFPTTTRIDSHYLTAALPFFVLAAIETLSRLRVRRYVVTAFLSLVATFLLWGRWPTSHVFRSDAQTRAAQTVMTRMLELDPEATRSVQAPDALLPHLAERSFLARSPLPDRDADFVVFDISHRRTYEHSENLLRTVQEPILRDWLARSDYGVVKLAHPYLLFVRGADSRNQPGLFSTRAFWQEPVQLTSCLSAIGAVLIPDGVAIHFEAHGACPSDLALRIGPGESPRRVDLLFDGRVSPARLRAGDRVVSRHLFRPGIVDETVWVGLLRQSGARPEFGDPISVAIPLTGPQR